MRCWDTQGERDLPQFRLDDADVARTHAQQLFLRRRQRFEAIVSVPVADPFRLEAFRSIDRRCVQERDDRALERVVERIGRSEIALCFFDPRLERRVELRRPRRVDRCNRICDRRVAIVAARIDEGAAVVA